MKKLLTVLLLFAAIGLSAQSYTETYFANAGNPGGLNTESDATTTGWTAITTGSQSANTWSSMVVMPFSIDFFGATQTRFKVSQNGLLTFDIAAPDPPANANTTLPAAGLPDNTIAMFWDEFTLSPPTGSNDIVYWKVFGTAPNQQLWIKYFSFEYSGYSFAYWACVLEESTNKIYIVDMSYRSGTGGATVGLQQNAGNAVMQAGSPNILFNSGGSAYTDNDYWEYTPLVAGAPFAPTNPNPPSGSVGVPFNGTLTWDWGADSETYDLMLGPVGNMVAVVTGGSVVYPSGSYPYSLNPATDYEWQLIVYNSNKATTAGPVWTFNTACATITSFPWLESFENGGAIPNCWYQDAANTEDWLFRTTMTYAANADHTTGTGYFATIDDSSPYAAIPSGLLTPIIDVTGITTPVLDFWYWIGVGNAGPSYIEVEVWDGTAWQNAGITLTENSQWDQVFVDLTPYSNASLQVRFLAYENTANFNCDLAIDDVEIFDAITGDLTGVVTDASMNPIAGAVVDCGGYVSAPTAADGIYTINGILVGTYDVTCTAPGYNDASVTGVTIAQGANTLDFTLTAPTMDITPAVISVDVFPGGITANGIINVANNGNGPLDFFGGLTFLTEKATNLSFEEVAATGTTTPDVESAPSATIMKGGIDNKAMWDVSFAFEGNEGAQPGIETDGQYIYTSTWSASFTTPYWFHVYDFNGNLVSEFDIAGATAIRDLAYDGTYFYGGAASNLIYVMDFSTQTLVGTIPTATGVNVRHIAYDPLANGGAGGFWVGDFATLYQVDMAGNTLITVAAPGMTAMYGSAYDGVTSGGPYLWFNDPASTGQDPYMKQWDIATQTLTGVQHLATDLPGFNAGISGGLCSLFNPMSGQFLLIGTLQQTPQLIFGYVLEDGWVDYTPKTGTLAAGTNTDLAVTFNSKDYPVGTTKTAEATFTSYPNVGTGSVQLIMNVIAANIPIGWCNLQWPPTMNFDAGNTSTAYAQVWVDGITNAPGPGVGMNAWIGISTTNTDPSTWTTWIPATYNQDYGNNDEWMADLGAGLLPGTYYYASRFNVAGGPDSYGGYNAGGGGFWDGVNNVSGVLTINDPPALTWTGAVDNNWDDPNNWDIYAIPVATTDVTIPAGLSNYPTLTGPAFCNNLLIGSNGASVGTLLDNGFLTVGGTTTIERDYSGLSSSTILITEIDLGAPDAIEVQNVTGAAFDASNYIVAVSNSYTDINSVNTVFWNLGTFAAGEAQFKDDNSSGGQYWGSNLFWNPGAYPSFTGWAMILDNTTGAIVDFVIWNWTAPEIAAMNPTIGTWSVTIGDEWTGDPVDGNCTLSLQRQGSGDNNDNADWICQTQSMGTTNVGLNIPFAGGGDAWHLISSPIANAVSGVYTGMYLQTYNETAMAWTDIIPTTVPLVPVSGYALWTGDYTATYSGIMNTGVQSIGVTANNPFGWNLLGNPYPSGIDWDMVTIPGYLNGAIYYLDAASGNYVSYNGGMGGGSQYVPPMQGFFVSATGNGLFSLDDAARTHDGGGMYYKEGFSNMLVLSAEGSGYTDNAYIRFDGSATAGFDGQYDAYKLLGLEYNNVLPQVSTVSGSDLSINVLPFTEVIPVNFRSGVDGTFTIGISENHDLGYVVLEDLLNGQTQDLLTGAYTFEYSVTDEPGRFLLHFEPLSVPEYVTEGAMIYSYGSDVYVQVPEDTEGTIMVYDMLGQLVTSKAINSQLSKISLDRSSYYVVKVLDGQEVVTRKVYID